MITKAATFLSVVVAAARQIRDNSGQRAVITVVVKLFKHKLKSAEIKRYRSFELKPSIAVLTQSSLKIETMSGRIWLTSEDGAIDFVSLTKENLRAALDLLYVAFFPHENVCTAVGLSKNQEAMKELEELSANTAHDGVSIVAIEKNSGAIVGVAFNKLQYKTGGNEHADYFEKFARNCQQAPARGVVEFMAELDSKCDLFTLLNVDCIFEIMFLATHPIYRGRQISTKLCEASIQLAQRLNCGENVKVSLDGSDLKLEPTPKAVSAIFTSFITQRIGEKLKFSTALVVNYNDISFEGETYSSKIDAKSRYTTVEYKLL